MLRLLRRGRRYEGEVCFCSDPELVPWPGYYAVARGKLRRRRRLVWVDDAPGDPGDGSGHFEEAR